MARYSWAATSSDTLDGSDRSAKKSLRFSTHSVSWKGSTGVVPFQAFLQLSTVRLYSFFAPDECGMAGLQGMRTLTECVGSLLSPFPSDAFLPLVRPLGAVRTAA